MRTPITLLCGAAGSGKDTVAGMLRGDLNAAVIAQADPMKQFAARVFGFTEHQLWGPSEARNAEDTRFLNVEMWDEVAQAIKGYKTEQWVADVLGTGTAEGLAFLKLWDWFSKLALDHGFSAVYKTEGSVFVFNCFKRDSDLPRAHYEVRHVKPLTPRYVLQTLGTEWGRSFSPSMWNNLAIRNAKTLLRGGHAYDRLTGVSVDPTQNYDHVIITDGRFRNEVVGVIEAGGATVKIASPTETELGAGVVGHASEAELKQIPNSLYDLVFINNKAHGLDRLKVAVTGLAYFLRRGPVTIGTAPPADET